MAGGVTVTAAGVSVRGVRGGHGCAGVTGAPGGDGRREGEWGGGAGNGAGSGIKAWSESPKIAAGEASVASPYQVTSHLSPSLVVAFGGRGPSSLLGGSASPAVLGSLVRPISCAEPPRSVLPQQRPPCSAPQPCEAVPGLDSGPPAQPLPIPV